MRVARSSDGTAINMVFAMPANACSVKLLNLYAS